VEPRDIAAERFRRVAAGRGGGGGVSHMAFSLRQMARHVNPAARASRERIIGTSSPRPRRWGAARPLNQSQYMDDPVPDEVVQGDLTEAQKRDHVIRLAFGGRLDRFDAFCRAV